MWGRATNFSNVVSLFGALAATAVMLGLFAAGLVLPALAGAGAAARQGVHVFDSLPGEFTQTPLSQQSRILASDGTLIATPYDENRVIVPLAQIAPVMQEAQIAIEDNRFYEHGGLDPQGVGRALLSNLRGGDTQGASSLTQQYVKITLQENALRNDDMAGVRAATARSYIRKLQELKYAVTLEKNLSKDQILQGYLNLVYYGDRAYGVEAAARHFFSVSAAELDLPQAATLAGLVQQPGTTDPIHHPGRALARRNVVLDRMHTLKLISDQVWLAARGTKLVVRPRAGQNSCGFSPYPYFCNYVTAWLRQLPALGNTPEERDKRLNRGGLTIQTTLNPAMQLAAEQELKAKVPVGTVAKGWDIGAAAAVVEPGTGHVLAIAQNTDFSIRAAHGKTALNWAVDAKYGGSGGFAFGSTAKSFAVAQALRSGMPIDSTVIARAADARHAAFFFPHEFYTKVRKSEKPCRIFSPWRVFNDEGTRNGPISLGDAAAYSVNTAFAGLVAKLGTCAIRDLMKDMGLHKGNGEPITPGPSAVTLGSDSASPLTLASAYATLASGGTYCEPSPVLIITTSDHKTIGLDKNPCRRVLDPDIANGVTKILKTVITKGTASGTGGLAGGRPAAGKTGTAGNSLPSGGTNETWFAGYTPQLSTVVWVGTPDDPGQTARLENLTIGGTFYPGEIFGATIAAPIWKQIMDRASTGMPLRDFADPGSVVQFGDFPPIPDVAGMSLGSAVAALTAAGFQPVVGGAVNSAIPAGHALGTQPASRALRGSPVVIVLSTGHRPPPPVAAPPPPHLVPLRPAAVPPPHAAATPPIAASPTTAALPIPSTSPNCRHGLKAACTKHGRK
jgi:membrane peptidoglycan carboxypeptidase